MYNLEVFNPPFNVIIFSGGKTAGSTLNNTFLHLDNTINPYHIHRNSFFTHCQLLGLKGIPQTVCPKSIFEYISPYRCYFIDVYRNPIDRKISSYFQNYEHNKKHFKVPENISIEDEVDFFHINIFHHIENYESFAEVLEHFNIQSLEYKGDYWYLEKNNRVFIRLKFSKIEEWENILTKIFNKKIILKSHNLSSEKEYFQKYKMFKMIYLEKYN